MKLVYSGGMNKYSWQGIEDSIFFTCKEGVKRAVEKGEKVAFVTLAKPDRYYDLLIIPSFQNKVDIIDNTNLKEVERGKYDVIVIPGGETRKLHRKLITAGFSLKALKPEAIYIGDSAGAMIMAAYYYEDEEMENGDRRVRFFEGLASESELIAIVHANNPNYTDNFLKERVRKFAEKKNLRVCELAEGQMVMADASGKALTPITAEEIWGRGKGA